ncbi:hypothetical protein AMIS_57920 [Actinoplanes missouriensis 431]|uniref:DUF4360 domain-containing protein n=1 Tax=Actinoplanes missouriensis (strain ATCC 14538 / DSM 43046 / CBS 188.64 / JCM 3121 / NBRC 102363 / NCIMB 12654 / NRRL B-3342 / UNCC 431) TaxID=512565 RepID=I0HDC5_ACTM4|nr:DUF4360 domain-containing protein [Actinoplanes missouriensis]BAL91012.1 hypothetical protein AMIS_57920 [Actinoplanes missouriensis 431]
MLNALTAGAMAVSSLTAPAAPPPTTEMVIDVVKTNGTGCPPGSAEVIVSPDNKAFTVSYSKFVAQVGPETAATDVRKNCQLLLNVLVPDGYTYAVAGVDYRGYANLQKGVTATESAFYYFQGESHTTEIKHELVGYLADEWQHSDRVPVESMSFLDCDNKRYLSVNTELKVDPANADRSVTNWVAMDSIDGDLETTYHVAWKRC